MGGLESTASITHDFDKISLEDKKQAKTLGELAEQSQIYHTTDTYQQINQHLSRAVR